MPFILALLAALSQAADTVLAAAERAAAALPDTAAARAAGFVPLAFGRVADLSPFQGQHWLHLPRLATAGSKLDEPSFVMFVPVNGKWRAVGLAYSRRIGSEDTVPTALGARETPWHLHQLCFNIPGEGRALADGVEDCRARGGAPTPRQLAMVHAWTGVPSPEGPYSHENVALPYVAVGLSPPAPDALTDPARAQRARALGMALGETYGALLPYQRRVELFTRDRALVDSLAWHRAALQSLVPRLREAERSGDPGAFDAAAGQVLAEWEALRGLYRRMAPTPETQAQLERQTRAALGEAEAHHHH